MNAGTHACASHMHAGFRTCQDISSLQHALRAARARAPPRDAAMNGMRRRIAGKTPSEIREMSKDAMKEPVTQDDFLQVRERLAALGQRSLILSHERVNIYVSQHIHVSTPLQWQIQPSLATLHRRSVQRFANRPPPLATRASAPPASPHAGDRQDQPERGREGHPAARELAQGVWQRLAERPSALLRVPGPAKGRRVFTERVVVGCAARRLCRREVALCMPCASMHVQEQPPHA